MGGDRPVVLVSACLLGVPCNHLGESNASAVVQRLAERHRLVPVCPEVIGGLPTPRPPAAVSPDGRVLTQDGDDVTDAYRRGAEATVQLALAVGARRAVLKARSPSCGCHEVYADDWSGRRVPGPGVTAAALAAAGVPVSDEEDRAASAGGAPTMERPSGA